MQRIDNKRKQKKMDYDIKWKNIQRILTRTKKSSKIKVQSKKRKEKGRNADGCRERFNEQKQNTSTGNLCFFELPDGLIY